jgi:hypothetical protein
MKTEARGLSQSALPRQRGSHGARLSHTYEARAEGSRRTHMEITHKLAEDSCHANSSASTRRISNPETTWSPPGWTVSRRATWEVCASMRYSECSIRYTRSLVINVDGASSIRRCTYCDLRSGLARQLRARVLVSAQAGSVELHIGSSADAGEVVAALLSGELAGEALHGVRPRVIGG